jgi:NAD(P)-dependent dehydrogenase (short-subunit alcohol dehydrogenase family)
LRTAAEVAALVAFVAPPAAFVTGTTINFDGGLIA